MILGSYQFCVVSSAYKLVITMRMTWHIVSIVAVVVGICVIYTELSKLTFMPVARSPRELSVYELRMVAYHEAGHAIASMYTPWAREVVGITTIPRGDAFGETSYVPMSSTFATRARTFADVDMTFGGFVGEETAFGFDSVTCGSKHDLQIISDNVRAVVYTHGLGESRAVCLKDRCELTAAKEDEVEEYVAAAYRRVKRLMSAHIDDLHALAAALIANRTLSGEQVKAILPPPYKYTPIEE